MTRAGTCDNIVEELGQLLQAHTDAVLFARLVPLLELGDEGDIEPYMILGQFNGPVEVVNIHEDTPVDWDLVG